MNGDGYANLTQNGIQMLFHAKSVEYQPGFVGSAPRRASEIASWEEIDEFVGRHPGMRVKARDLRPNTYEEDLSEQ